MRSLRLMLVATVLLSSAGLPAFAAPLACPDLSQAVQVNACPAEEELRHTYTSYCSDNAKAYANQTDSCVRFEDYRQMKNLALWESADGKFDSYVSCDLPVGEVKALQPTGMKASAQRGLTRLVCTYPKGINFTHRTRQTCTVDAACAVDTARCQATCQ